MRILHRVSAPNLAGPVHRPARVRLVRGFCRAVVRALFRLQVEGREHLATGPAIYCFNHLNWTDPIVVIAALPGDPRYALFGPKESDMSKGARNRLISWAGIGIPYQPAKTDLLDTTRRCCAVLDAGWVVVIAGEGRIHRGEHELLPLAAGPAYFALRAGVPIVPVASTAPAGSGSGDASGSGWGSRWQPVGGRRRRPSPLSRHEPATRCGPWSRTSRTRGSLARSAGG